MRASSPFYANLPRTEAPVFLPANGPASCACNTVFADRLNMPPLPNSPRANANQGRFAPTLAKIAPTLAKITPALARFALTLAKVTLVLARITPRAGTFAPARPSVFCRIPDIFAHPPSPRSGPGKNFSPPPAIISHHSGHKLPSTHGTTNQNAKTQRGKAATKEDGGWRIEAGKMPLRACLYARTRNLASNREVSI